MNKNRPICLFLSYSLHFNFVPIRRKPIKVIRKIHERAQFHNDIRDLSREEKICDQLNRIQPYLSLLRARFANILSGDKPDLLLSASGIEVEATRAIQHPEASSYVSGACRYRNSVNYITGGCSHSDERPVSAAIATNGEH